MGEIRIVGPHKTRGYPYLVCKKKSAHITSEVVSFSLLLLIDNFVMANCKKYTYTNIHFITLRSYI